MKTLKTCIFVFYFFKMIFLSPPVYVQLPYYEMSKSFVVEQSYVV